MSIQTHQSYRTYLRNVMSEKAQRNPKFSLRAMALLLGVAPSFLSTVLKGDKNLSFEMANRFAEKLGLNDSDRDYFCLLVQKEATKDPNLRESLAEKVRLANPNHTDLSVEHFKVISNPLHFSILSATTLTGFEATAKSLAHALAVPQVEVELALERLESLEMIEKNERGFYEKVKANPRVVSQSPNQALRKFHRETLTKAIDSLETQSPQEKVIGSETFTIDESQIEDFRKLADEFFDRALLLAKKSKKKTQVYHLGIQFFNLSPNLKSSKRKKS